MKYTFIYTLLILVFNMSAQVTLDQVLSDLEKASPELKLINLSKESAFLKEKNIANVWKPQLSFTAQSTYQSDVTSLNVELPGINIPTVSEFQYKAQGEVSQMLWDAGRIKARKKATYINSLIEQKQSEIQLDQVKAETIKLYFNILESEKIIGALQLKSEVLDVRRAVLKAGVDNGVVLESELYNLDAAILELEQEIIQAMNHKLIGIQSLTILIGREYPVEGKYALPEEKQEISKLETLKYYELLDERSAAIDAIQKVNDSDSKPQLVAFGQVGLGNPGLNFLEEGLTDYYIIGMKLNWKLGNLYNRGNDRQINILMKDKLTEQKNIFDRNWQAAEIQFKNQVDVQEEIIQVNKSLVQLRASISKVAAAQLDNGIINSADYISRLNEEYGARINLDIARIRKLRNQYLLLHHYNLLP